MSCNRLFPCCIVLFILCGIGLCCAEPIPPTEGETLSGHRIVLAQAIKGHASLIIASFSKDAGPACEEWSKTVLADPTLASVTVYQAANLERAPGFVRGFIKSSMRKQIPAFAHDTFVVFTMDDALWRSYFGVTNDKDPYLVLIDATGQVRWHGHGTAPNLEPLLKAALK